MATRKTARSSAVRPKDRPARRGAARSGSTARQTARRTGRVGGGRSPLNPGFPRWAVLTGLVLVLAVAGAWVLLGSSYFGVRQVQVSGATVLTGADVRGAVGLGPGTPLASVDTGAVAERVEQLAPVAAVRVSRSWPGTLVVQITERVPVATVDQGGEPWLIDAEGVVYAAASQAADQAAGLLTLEVNAPSPDDYATREAVQVIAGLDQETRELVAKVVAPSAAQVTLVLHDGRRVIWGDSSRMNDKRTMLTGVLSHDGSIFDISSPGAIVIK